MKSKFIHLFMDIADRVSKLSYARRLKVGAIAVKDDRIISLGYNGMPAGWDNDCEYKEWMPDSDKHLEPSAQEERWPCHEVDPYLGDVRRYALRTKPEVIHAERNVIDKLAASHENGKDALMFITHAPCLECAKSIYTAGMATVYYNNDYRSTDGITFLKNCGINVIKYNNEN